MFIKHMKFNKVNTYFPYSVFPFNPDHSLRVQLWSGVFSFSENGEIFNNEQLLSLGRQIKDCPEYDGLEGFLTKGYPEVAEPVKNIDDNYPLWYFSVVDRIGQDLLYFDRLESLPEPITVRNKDSILTIKVVPYILVRTKSELDTYLNYLLSKGYENIYLYPLFSESMLFTLNYCEALEGQLVEVFSDKIIVEHPQTGRVDINSGISDKMWQTLNKLSQPDISKGKINALFRISPMNGFNTFIGLRG